MKHDPAADALSAIKNAEKIGKKSCILPNSSIIAGILKVLRDNSYIGTYELVDDGRGGVFKLRLVGRINDCKIIRPRFAVKSDEFKKWEQRFLPSRGFGLLILSTSQGVMTQNEATEKKIGGRLLAYVY